MAGIVAKQIDVGAPLTQAAAALLEAASRISQLEIRIQRLEAKIGTFLTLPLPAAIQPRTQPLQPEIDAETRTHVNTSLAARWLNRQPQTLRKWACYEDGPLRPIRVNGRLSWAVAEIRRVLSIDHSRRQK